MHKFIMNGIYLILLVSVFLSVNSLPNFENRTKRENNCQGCLDDKSTSNNATCEPKLCGQPTKGTTQNPPVFVRVNPFLPTQITPEGSCLRPPNPPNGVIYIGNSQTGSPLIVDNNGALLLKCNPGYTPTDDYIAFCIESILSTSLTCKKATCEPVKSISAHYVCVHNGVSDSKFCEPENLIIGTQVNYKCRYGYESLDQPISKQDSVCQMKNNVPTWVPSLFECVPQCGIQPPKHSSIIEHPWHCVVFKKIEREFRRICGGTLIDRGYILSAAHCFNEPDHPELYIVRFNGSNGVKEYQIKKIIIHPYFSNEDYESDISFIVLSKEVQISSEIMPACIDFNQRYDLLSPGSVGQVAGWGPNNEILPSTNMQYRPYKECRDNAPRVFQRYISGRKLCANYINGTDICRKSGSGLMFESKKEPSHWYLMGITSIGLIKGPSCDLTSSIIFTSIRDELNWIKGEYKENRN